MYILGLSEGHDSTAALLKDGKMVGLPQTVNNLSFKIP